MASNRITSPSTKANGWSARQLHQALHSGNLQHTFQHGHPGVTTMWSGMAGYLLRFPEYVQIAPGQFSWSN